MSDINALKNKRKIIKASITRHQTAVTQFKSGDNIATVARRAADLTSLFKEYGEIQSQIELKLLETLSESNDQGVDAATLDLEANQERLKVENQYFDTIGEIDSLVAQYSQNPALNKSPIADQTNININRNVLERGEPTFVLEPLPLPSFSGAITGWFTFFDSFKALVHENNNISKIKKYHYLRGCLKDEAFRAIESLTVSNENYDTAIETLIKRFENKRLIVYQHVSNILKQDVILKPSHVELRQLLDTVNNNLASLKSLELPIDTWDSLLIPILSEKLDFHTKREWQALLDKELPTYAKFNDFLEKRYQILESLNSVKNTNPSATFNFKNPRSNNSSQQYNTAKKFSTHVVSKRTCVFCKGSHNSYQCSEFLALTITERLDRAKRLRLCHNCLMSNHSTDNCKSIHSCKECNQRHHSLLHINPFTPAQNSLHVSSNNQVLLTTVKLLIANKNGQFHYCRALLDQCSEANLINASFCNRLGLKTRQINSSVSGVNTTENPVSQAVKITIKSRVTDFATNLDCLVLSNITRPTPSVTFDKTLIEIPSNINLADPDFHISENIDLLIGAQLFWRLLIGSPIQTKPNQPYLQETKLGWIVGGELNTKAQTNVLSCNFVAVASDNLENQIAKFWEQEEVKPNLERANEQSDCETHFLENTIRGKDNKFIVRLPFKNQPSLGDSRSLALKQFLTLEKRLLGNPLLSTAYKTFITEYQTLGHMQRVPQGDLENPKAYYLPHHAVFKQTTEGQKIRVVFNASAKTKNGQSLNDNLMVGPVVQEDLFSILCRFRTHRVVLSADITKMYRMVAVNTADQDYQRILWRNAPDEPIQTFRLTTVTYGTSPASFLACRVLKQLAIEFKQRYPKASEIISRDFYVDDLLSGMSSVQDAITIRDQITKILASGGFNLCKWASNNSQVLAGDHNKDSNIIFDKNGDIKVLGFYWNCEDDQLKYKVNIPDTFNKPITKRHILSMISKIFDPLGLVNPVIVKAKILMQGIWSLKLRWDEPVPKDQLKIWSQFIEELPELNNCRINRNVTSQVSNHHQLNTINSIELHGFSDASSKAYGAAIYIKVIDDSESVSINLLCAKSRVAPLKKITLPRLELNAAVLLAKLMSKISDILALKINRKYYWTDSTIVLSWLAEHSSNWKPYVANRVSSIHEISSPNEWRHVRSGDNPADIVSRGAYPRKLNSLKIWWHGPEFLEDDAKEWPSLLTKSLEPENSNLLERRPTVSLNVAIEPELPVITKFSSLAKLQRVIAYCLRFIKKLKNKTGQKKCILQRGDKLNNNSCSLSVDELNNALTVILLHVQNRAFAKEIREINLKLKTNKLTKLDPFIDHKGLLRVGGRLKHALIAYDNKFPIILPEKHHLTRLIVIKAHEQELHAGNQATLASIRQQFWPLSGRSAVKSVIRNCFKCTRVNPIRLSQKMGNLPKERLQPTRPFYISGVDYAGPFLIKDGKTRNTRKVKAYIALFICFSTKAVHLELVGDLTTESFLAALKRFVARRGMVAELFSDNGTNFVGAEREIFRSQGFRNAVTNKLAEKTIKFNFIPARSPHWGGVWERAVRSVKHHLKRVVGDASLTYEEFYTLLTSVEACLNSRPITPLSEDPNDLQALTPGHFLIGAPLTAPSEEDVRNISHNRLSRWKRIQQLQQHFWQRWHKEYLHQLQIRPKGQRGPQPNITVGALVVLVEEDVPPLRWKLGRVVSVHPGSDGLVRAVTVKTANCVTKRSVKKVCAIPTDDQVCP